jgi:hypothetical protein
MSTAEPSEQEEGTIRIPVATFINNVEEFLSSEFCFNTLQRLKPHFDLRVSKITTVFLDKLVGVPRILGCWKPWEL